MDLLLIVLFDVKGLCLVFMNKEVGKFNVGDLVMYEGFIVG